jgi:peptidoglycan hydrolase FlgJ
MATTVGIGAIGRFGGPAAKPGDDPKKVTDAARQFEAMLIEQMMKSARTTGGGMMGSEDESGAALGEMAEQQFAQLLANNGGIGLAKLVAAGLQQTSKIEPAEREVPSEDREPAITGTSQR